jgi:signal transduction histidine kinase
MLLDVSLLILVLVVALLIVIDVRRTPSESPREQADGQARESDREVIQPTRAAADAAKVGPAVAAVTTAAQDAEPAGRAADVVHASANAPRRTSSRFALKNWRVRSRLVLLVFIPTVTALYFAGARIASSVQSAAMVHGSGAAHDTAVTSVVIDSVVVLLILLLALVTTSIVGRSMVRPLRRLQAGALEVAGLRLPEAVREMSEAHGEGVPLEVEPINVDSRDEIGEVARAFDQVHREALRLAANEAALRANVNAIFVNLSRRSQSLVERQIRLIDDLEQGEQDSERLSNLFQMDHLATRMRRNSENLLVLAGHDISRFWNQPLPLVDVLRAALSEIEQYERVTLNVQPGIAVRGQVVSDIVHLTAELIENATSFSAAETPVSISGHLLGSGGVLLEITDQGVGMSAEEMAHANWRLDNPPVVDVAVSRRMGLFVVARLAAKHGIRVRLRPAASGGLIALVWLPDEAIMHESPAAPAGLRGPGSAVPESAAALGADGFTSGLSGDVGRTTAEQEVSAARTPRFAPLRAEAEETGLPMRPVPWAGRRSRSEWPTGPLPNFRTVPRPATESGTEPADTGPQPVGRTDAEPAIEPGAEATPGAHPAAAAYQPFGTGAQPAGTAAAEPFDSIPLPVAGTPPSGDLPAGEADYRPTPPVKGTSGWDAGPSNGEVLVPSADGLGEGNRLPIFEAVESDWFRRGRQAVGRRNASSAWSSAADAGWRAAEAVSTPASAGVTSAGLPKRVPRANLVPGSVGAEAGEPVSVPTRSAAATRDRFASFQQGVKKGRAAAGGDEAGGGGDGAGGEDEASG